MLFFIAALSLPVQTQHACINAACPPGFRCGQAHVEISRGFRSVQAETACPPGFWCGQAYVQVPVILGESQWDEEWLCGLPNYVRDRAHVQVPQEKPENAQTEVVCPICYRCDRAHVQVLGNSQAARGSAQTACPPDSWCGRAHVQAPLDLEQTGMTKILCVCV